MADEIYLEDEDEEEEDDEDEEEEEGKKGKKDRAFDGDLGRGLMKSRTILFTDGVDAKLAARITAQLLILDQQDPKKPIRMFINSPGGQADSGFAIYDTVRFIRAPVQMIVAGMAASAAAIVLAAPPKENRFSFPHSRILIHQPSVAFRGVASDIKIGAQQILKMKEQGNLIISEATGQPLAKVSEDSDRDFWLTAEEAVEYGMIGKIIRNIGEIG
jgi:ATP-dependent Clp protease protease subunit